MKKWFCVCISVLLICSCALAENVFVSISTSKGLALAFEAVEASDLDGDGVVSINDALLAAHELGFEGGAKAGYDAAVSEYGRSLNRLWGEENGGSYGYYVNNASALSLNDVVADGDYIYAYAYTDLETWSDTYAFFEFAEIETGADFELTLMVQTYDADWNSVYLPVEGAIITLNGADSAYRTDADGKVLLDLEAGQYLISARSEAMTLVPPVCKATIG